MRKEIIGNCELYCGDCLEILPTLGMVDAVITDPPYCSGGMSVAEKTKPTGIKYGDCRSNIDLPDFETDSLDQRLWGQVMGKILRETRRKTRPYAPFMFFIDWRQLPALTDLLMLASFRLRGVVVWNKGNGRPRAGGFRQDTEFIIWGAAKMKIFTAESVILPGCFTVKNEMNNASFQRYHQTQKPLALMRQLLQITKTGDLVLDPFMGSGTTGVACVEMGRRFIGIEINEKYFDIACKRIEQAAAQGKLFDTVEAAS